MQPPPRQRPEILAPAGSLESFAAAIASGADAVYLGLSEGFNARSRSNAFSLDNLGALVSQAHLANVRVYLTLNTLVFENELLELEQLLRRVVACGVDALIVQDPATAFIARRLAPELRLHASTQMTISSPEGARFAATLGMARVVLPRELSSKEVALFTQGSPLEAEVFVHGALCMAWSGQCLTSEAFSERSANRGQCSQACRMPYEAIVDGVRQDLGDKRYLLSPQDLAAHDALPELLDAGIHSLKIEGRYKGAAYVSTAVDSWRHWRDALMRGVTEQDRKRLQEDVERTQLTFSRGGSIGFLRGDNHQELVVATTPKHRGLPLGAVLEVRSRSVVIRLDTANSVKEQLRPGLGIKFELVGRSDREHDPENAPGGPLFEVRPLRANQVELCFGNPGPNLKKVRVGDIIRLTGNPALAREAERRIAQPPVERIALRMSATGSARQPLVVSANADVVGRTLHASLASEMPLAEARSGSGLDRALLSEKLASLGGSPFHLEQLDTTQLTPGLYLPVAELKRLRRELVAELERQLSSQAYAEPPAESCLDAIRTELRGQLASEETQHHTSDSAVLVPLCRTEEQLEAVIDSLGAGAEVELDWMEMVGLTRAVARAQQAGLRVTLATVRVQKPGEEAYDRRIAKLQPSAVLVRHWGALMHFAEQRKASANLRIHGDFSLNVTNSFTAQHLLNLGLDTVTASHDLNKSQLLALLRELPRGRVALTLHHHIPTFHNSHCVYAHLLSEGTDYRNCGRPCEQHRIALRDYAGHEHPMVVDVSCRNTMFNAFAQSAAPLVPQLLELGVRRFRVELVWENATEVSRTLGAYQRLLAGEITPQQALAEAAVHERYGVTTPLKLRKKR